MCSNSMYRFCCAGQGAFHFLSDIGEVADNGTPTTALVPEVDLVRSLAEEGKIFLQFPARTWIRTGKCAKL